LSVVVDGKKIKRVAKRLLPTRNQPGKLYGGKLLVAFLPAEGVAVGLAADVDGEANDIRSASACCRYVRRVTLIRPGGEDVGVITGRLDDRQYPAADLLAIYLTRWQIENVFQQITEVFHLQRLIGCRRRCSRRPCA
jgi:hypothetical protein